MSVPATDPEPASLESFICCRGERVYLCVDKATGDIYTECSGCQHMQLLHDDDQFAEAEAGGIAWAEQVARDCAAALDDLGTAGISARACHELANILHGGDLANAARQEMARRFNLPADFNPGGDHG